MKTFKPKLSISNADLGDFNTPSLFLSFPIIPAVLTTSLLHLDIFSVPSSWLREITIKFCSYLFNLPS